MLGYATGTPRGAPGGRRLLRTILRTIFEITLRVSADTWALEDPLEARGKPSTYVSVGRARRTCQFNYELNTFIAAQLSNTTNVEV